MAEVRRTANEARREARANWERIDATSEAEMRRHAQEDGEDPDNDRPFVEPVESIRRRLGMSQAQFSAAIHVPLRTIQNWEQKRTRPDQPALALLRILAREPEAALKALSM